MARSRCTDRPFHPWNELDRLRQGLDQLARGPLRGEHGYRADRFSPPLNLLECPGWFEIKAEMPGVALKDIDIRIEGETLTLRGVRKPFQVIDGGNGMVCHRREIEVGEFSRTISLSVRINVDAVQARLKNGILTITLPRAVEVAPRRVEVAID